MIAQKLPNILPGGEPGNPNVVGSDTHKFLGFIPCQAETSICSKVLNMIPTINGIAAHHDAFLDSFGGWNVPTMFSSAIVTYGAVIYEAPAGPLEVDQNHH